jgi:hypothetical protein
VYLLDLRYTDRGSVHEYQAFGPEHGGNVIVYSLALDRRHNALLSGGTGGIVCWDFQTGASRLRWWNDNTSELYIKTKGANH